MKICCPCYHQHRIRNADTDLVNSSARSAFKLGKSDLAITIISAKNSRDSKLLENKMSSCKKSHHLRTEKNRFRLYLNIKGIKLDSDGARQIKAYFPLLSEGQQISLHEDKDVQRGVDARLSNENSETPEIDMSNIFSRGPSPLSAISDISEQKSISPIEAMSRLASILEKERTLLKLDLYNLNRNIQCALQQDADNNKVTRLKERATAFSLTLQNLELSLERCREALKNEILKETKQRALKNEDGVIISSSSSFDSVSLDTRLSESESESQLQFESQPQPQPEFEPQSQLQFESQSQAEFESQPEFESQLSWSEDGLNTISRHFVREKSTRVSMSILRGRISKLLENRIYLEGEELEGIRGELAGARLELEALEKDLEAIKGAGESSSSSRGKGLRIQFE